MMVTMQAIDKSQRRVAAKYLPSGVGCQPALAGKIADLEEAPIIGTFTWSPESKSAAGRRAR